MVITRNVNANGQSETMVQVDQDGEQAEPICSYIDITPARTKGAVHKVTVFTVPGFTLSQSGQQ
jgi:hypothetical protein